MVGFAKPFLESQFGKDLPSGALTAIQLVPAHVVFICSLQRLANLGMSRLWILGNLIPILNLWIGYRSFACPAGYAYHKKMDGVGIFLAIVYWLVVAAAIAVVVVVALALFGVIGDPELQNKAKEAFEQAMKAKAEAPAK